MIDAIVLAAKVANPPPAAPPSVWWSIVKWGAVVIGAAILTGGVGFVFWALKEQIKDYREELKKAEARADEVMKSFSTLALGDTEQAKDIASLKEQIENLVGTIEGLQRRGIEHDRTVESAWTAFKDDLERMVFDAAKEAKSAHTRADDCLHFVSALTGGVLKPYPERDTSEETPHVDPAITESDLD